MNLEEEERIEGSLTSDMRAKCQVSKSESYLQGIYLEKNSTQGIYVQHSHR